MNIIHFTRAATDPLISLGSSSAFFLPLADGQGNTHISCLHLDMNGKIEAPSITHAAALLVVHGRITIEPHDAHARINIHAGMGAVFAPNEPYTLNSEAGAIVLIVESQEFIATARAISTPQRIEGATWPSDQPSGR
jgi:redox-sensitive bicupin YhaK (pirin superfamily)